MGPVAESSGKHLWKSAPIPEMRYSFRVEDRRDMFYQGNAQAERRKHIDRWLTQPDTKAMNEVKTQ